MARLRNRILKATFWTDGELLRWPRDKRWTYQGIWEMAEDSGCLEDDPFDWKMTLFPSPLDADITVDDLERWRDELIAARKLVPYEADGKRYLFIMNFHQHERPRNPQPPDLSLPPWVQWVTETVKRTDGRENKRHRYEVDTETLAVRLGLRTEHETAPQKVATDSVQTRYGPEDVTESGPRSGPVRSGPDPKTPLSAKEVAELPSPTAPQRVFLHYVRTMNRRPGDFMLDGKRLKLLQNAIRIYGEDRCTAAINGCRLSPHHMGQNDRNERFNDLELIFRDAKHIEGFIERAARANGGRVFSVAAEERIQRAVEVLRSGDVDGAFALVEDGEEMLEVNRRVGEGGGN